MPSERVIWGVPGCGKTTAGITLCREWADRGTAPDQIAYLAFTKAAAKAAATRLFETEDEARMSEEFPYFRTIHSLCYRALKKERSDLRLINTSDMKQFAKLYSMDGVYAVHPWEDLADVYAGMKDSGRSEWDQALSAYSFARIKARTIAELDRARLEPSPEGKMMLGIDSMGLEVYKTFVERYEKFKREDGLIDFSDMLEFGARDMKPFDDVRYVVLDEAQDLAEGHHLIVDRLFASAEEVWWIGDDDQCQPSGTKVLVSKDGATKDISELVVGDTVVSYDRPSASVVAGKKVLQVGRRQYRGMMHEIRVGDRVTATTSGHRFIARWDKKEREGKSCVTYLMERAGKWRVGWCQLFNAEKAFHVGVRANCEKADRAWILKVHRDRTDASIYESVLAARYSLPTVTFEPVDGANHLTRKAIDTIFGMIGDRSLNAVQCLVDHGREIGYPLVDRVNRKGRHRTTVIEIHACNLIPGWMLLPIPSKDPMKASWEPFELTSRFVDNETVYSLDVEKHHTYVADGIITHNSVFKFSGASAELFLERARKARYQIQLRQTHRFGQSIVDFSQQIIQRVKNRQPKEILGVEGQPGKILVTGTFEPVPGDVMILHRHVQGCQNVAQAYIDAGLPFRNERGRDPLSSFKRIRAWNAVRELSSGGEVSMTAAALMVEDLLPAVIVGQNMEKIRLVVHGRKSSLEELGRGSISLRDLVTGRILTEEGAAIVRDRSYESMRHSQDLDYYERVAKNGYTVDIDPADKIPRITTIHGAKGRQAKQTIVFSEMGQKCWEDFETEHRLAYVASTRTETDVTICMDSKVHWADAEYEYPTVPEAKVLGESHDR